MNTGRFANQKQGGSKTAEVEEGAGAGEKEGGLSLLHLMGAGGHSKGLAWIGVKIREVRYIYYAPLCSNSPNLPPSHQPPHPSSSALSGDGSWQGPGVLRGKGTSLSAGSESCESLPNAVNTCRS